MKLLAGLAPVLVVGAAFVAGGDTPSARATAVCAPILAGLGFFPIVFALSRRAALVLAVAIVMATGAGIALAARGRSGTDLEAAIGWIVLTFACFAGLVSPLLVLGLRAMAASAWLLIAGFACGGVLLVGRGLSSIPAPLLQFNPLIRALHHGLGFDWLRSTNMYPRVGTIYYAYPQRSDGILLAVAVAAGALVIAAMMALGRRRLAADPASP